MTEKLFFKTIADAGGAAYLVGGAVRDMIMNMRPHDKDYVLCGITVNNFVALFPQAHACGKKFPVFLLDIDSATCEIAFARREKKNGTGYKGFDFQCGADITIEEDLFRRDLTINSMACDADGNIIDPYGGRRDIANKTIRATSSHFNEDPIRALRAARQLAQFGADFEIEQNTLKAMGECGQELLSEPAERKFAELEKAMRASRPSLYFRALEKSGLLKQEFPEIFDLIGKTQPREFHPEGDAYEHTMMVLDETAKISSRAEVRFAALMHDIGKSVTPYDMLPHHIGHEEKGAAIIEIIAARMRLPELWRRSAVFTAQEHMRPARMKRPSKIRDLIRRLEHEPIGADGFYAVVSADNHGEKVEFFERYNELLDVIKHASKCTAIPKHLKGREIGEYLRQVETEAVARLALT